VLPYMKENGGGTIFYISSIVGRKGGTAGQTLYYTTKWGLNGFAACVFEDVRHLGIKVCTICPSLVNTELGVRPGPTEGIPGEKQMTSQDIVEAMQLVFDCGPSACPTEISLDCLPPVRAGYRALSKRIAAKL